jgi:hypothetical protein
MNMKRSSRNRKDDKHAYGDESGASVDPDETNDVLKRLSPLQDVPERDPAAVQSGRVAFMDSVRSMPRPVSPALPDRRKWWKNIRRKERSIMVTLVRVALALSMALGATGGTVAIAQASEPGEILYPIKVASEDVRLALTSDSEKAFDLLLEFAQERLEEIDALSEEGAPIPPQVTTRLQAHFEQALRYASSFDDANLVQAMERLSAMTQQQTQVIRQMQSQDAGNADGALQQTEQIVSRVRQAAEEGLEDPTTFRLRHGENRPEDAPEQPDSLQTGDGTPQNQQGAGGQQGPGNGSGRK